MPCSQKRGEGKKVKDLLRFALLAKVLTAIFRTEKFRCLRKRLWLTVTRHSQAYESQIDSASFTCERFIIASKHQKGTLIGLILCNARLCGSPFA